MKRFLCQLLLTALFLRAPFVVGASSDPSSPSSGGVFVPDAWVPPEVIADLRAKAEKGDAEAQYNLATYYANDGSRADGLATAMAWYRKAADQADPFAQFALGVMYRRGLGVPEDADTGAIWLSKAMNTVASFAKSNLAWANNEGRVVPSFVTSFIDEMRDKANDVALAQWFIGMFYATGFCVPKDATKAVEWYRRAADQGEKSGQLYLGLRYADGVGIPKDEIEALAWLNISAASGSDDAARSRDLLERNLGRDMRLVAQQRSKEILKEIEATKGRSQSKDPYSAIAITVTSSGSGAIVSSQGLILSAAHVVKGATTVEVIMATGKRPAQVLRIDEPNDVALLKIGGGPYPALPIAPSRNVRLGQTVATIGFPNTSLQGFSPKVTRGEISSVNGYADDPRSWQISVPVQPGNSGGPLLDEDGNLIGVVQAKLGLKAAAITGDMPQNVNYAVKSAYALALLEPYLGDNAPELNQPSRRPSFEDMVSKAQQSAVLILCY